MERSQRRKKKKLRRWYSISVDTLRLSVIPIVTLAAMGGGYFLYNSWREARIEADAFDLLEQAAITLERLTESREAVENFASDLLKADESLNAGRTAYDRRGFEEAIRHAETSVDILISVESSLGERGATGEANFVQMQGDVEFRRGEQGRWQPARPRIVLQAGDQVRTGRGSAKLRFLDDGSTFTVRPESQISVSRSRGAGGELGERSMEMRYGWLDVKARQPSRVTTPEAEARVERDSEGFVTYERSSGRARFGSYRGKIRIESQDGEVRTLDDLQQVVQLGERISQPRPLPAAPGLVQPQNNLEVDLDRETRLVLEWEPVGRASGYVLQISESDLFVDNVVEDPGRGKTWATLGIQGEGSFFWRVAALGEGDTQGPWSPIHRFRVVSLGGRSPSDDRTPPDLRLTSVSRHGNLFIVRGQTEPGATVSVNGEPAQVEGDGSFVKTVQFGTEGWAAIEVLAVDAWGNEAIKHEPVLVQVF